MSEKLPLEFGSSVGDPAEIKEIEQACQSKGGQQTSTDQIQLELGIIPCS